MAVIDPLGTASHPLRVAIIGSGPSGFYAAEHLLRQTTHTIYVDMFERLPTPYGLVRGGVAPDHQKIKSVTRAYERTASNPNFRFFGHVEFGTDVTRDDLAQHYHAVIYAVGAQTDRKMNIPGEDLPGSHPATEFVAWYNAHPDYADYAFDLDAERVAVVGLGNVAMDVIRILARTPDELVPTDIADYALEALRESRVKEIYVLGRRGPAQSAFTNPEIKELGELADASMIVQSDEVLLDPISQQLVESGSDKVATRNVEILKVYATQGDTGKRRKIIMRFCVSPVEILGDGKVQAIKLMQNRLVADEKGNLKAQPTGETEIIPVDLVFRSVGYYGQPLPDVPFDDRSGTIPNAQGRVLESSAGPVLPGQYVVGWIKRGPSGIIGTNKPDSVETVERLLEDLNTGTLGEPTQDDPQAIVRLLESRGVQIVTFADWQRIDQQEMAAGQTRGAPRVKFHRVEDMLRAIQEHEAMPGD
jgi:ferredoxin/flavodoxin---NADP+ reductase